MVAPILFSKICLAEEVIHHFDVVAKVNKDGSVDITENITVKAEGNQIKRGIYRDIPTQYKDRMGNNIRVPFDLKFILRDGKKEPHHIKTESNGLRIYLGDKDTYLPHGVYRYTIQYQVARVIGFFPTGDELYWNVTGNGWVFPIEKAQIRVNFPQNVKIIQSAGYTGAQNSREGHYIGNIYGSVFEAKTTNRLNQYEGFTIAVAVPPNTIQRETTFQQFKYFFQENSSMLILGGFSFMALSYLFLSWGLYGRDRKGLVFPQFDAPEKMSPDLLSYIYQQRYDTKAFAALIINALTHKKLNITERDNAILLAIDDTYKSDNQKVPNIDILRRAFSGHKTITLPKRRFWGPKVADSVAENLFEAQQLHKQYLTKDAEKYIDNNTKYIVHGCFIGATGALWAYFLTINEDEKFFIIIASVVLYTLITKLFGRIMPQYTLEGQKIVNHAEGLKMYITTAEEERMNKLYPKDVTPETFEKLLPYALALGVEQEWCDYFSTLVDEGMLMPQTTGYYSHYNILKSNLENLPKIISSSSHVPGASSGLTGGFSGGGGGGGGGGGW